MLTTKLLHWLTTTLTVLGPDGFAAGKNAIQIRSGMWNVFSWIGWLYHFDCCPRSTPVAIVTPEPLVGMYLWKENQSIYL